MEEGDWEGYVPQIIDGDPALAALLPGAGGARLAECLNQPWAYVVD
jgi:hypothetical protein